MADGEQEQGEQGGGEAAEGTVVPRGPHDGEADRNEQQPQATGHSSAPPVERLSGVGASGVPEHPGPSGSSDPQAGTPAQGDQEAAQ